MSIIQSIKNFLTPANAGKESVMADSQTTATPPAASGGTETTPPPASPPVAPPVAPPATPEVTAPEVKAPETPEVKAPEVPAAPATPEVKAPETPAAPEVKTPEVKPEAAKAALRAKVIAAQLPGVPEKLINLPDTDDETALTAAAKELRGVIESLPTVKLPDVGGVSKDGGTIPAAGGGAPKYTPGNSGLTAGQAELANSIKLPK